jgi:pimeloyl-ACP methyl ester carboxylesterase
MPGHLRYRCLLDALGAPEGAVVKELELCSPAGPPADDVLGAEVEALHRFAAAHGLDRFHLYGYSLGGTIALAYVAAHGDRVLSVALDEPATDLSEEDRQQVIAETPDFGELPEEERIPAFLRTVLQPGAPLPPAPPAAPEQLARASAAVAAASRGLRNHRIDHSVLRAYRGPVHMTYGSLSSPRWATMAKRLTATFADCTVKRYDGVHHLRTGHEAEPERVASDLRRLWERAEAPDPSLSHNT